MSVCRHLLSVSFLILGLGVYDRQYVRVANAKEAAKAAKSMVNFVKSTIEMVAMTMDDDEQGMDPYDKAIGGENAKLVLDGSTGRGRGSKFARWWTILPFRLHW